MTSPPTSTGNGRSPTTQSHNPDQPSSRSAATAAAVTKATKDLLVDTMPSGHPVEVHANLHAVGPASAAAAASTGAGQERGVVNAASSTSIDNAHGNASKANTSGLDNDASGRIPSAPASSQGDVNNRTLYLGNLHPFVTEDTLRDVFLNCDGITELKVIRDKVTQVSAGYGFARFVDQDSAAVALEKIGKAVLFGQEARINWAFQREQQETLVHHIHVFVGDLSPEITDAALLRAFQSCRGCSDARVQWDHATGRSRGYGFVSFGLQEDAEAAIASMHGQVIGGRRIRCGWAQHKADPVIPLDPEALDRADPTNTNIYVGNLSPSLTDTDVRRSFGAYGPIAEVKLHRKGAFGFVRFRYHNDAVRAILGMNGVVLDGKAVKCSWGRHPAVLPSGMQANLMLAAAAGMGPLAAPPPAAVGGVMGMPMAGNAAASMMQQVNHHQRGAGALSPAQLASGGGGMNGGGAHAGQHEIGGAAGGGGGHHHDGNMIAGMPNGVGAANGYGGTYVPPTMQYANMGQMYYRAPGGLA